MQALSVNSPIWARIIVFAEGVVGVLVSQSMGAPASNKMPSTTSSSSNTIYYSWVEGSVRKTRSVIVVDKKDAMAEFLQTFVLPLIASSSLVFG